MDTQDDPVVPRELSVPRRVLRWARAHPFRAILIAAGFFVVYEVATIPWFSVAQLALVNPAETALMRQRLRESDAAGKPLKIRQKWISLSRIPRPLVNAVVVAEDGTFYSHNGFDWFEVQASVEKNMKERRFARGASTITQQLAKNLYLSTSKDPIRKVKEVVITMLLERCLTKNRIMELYLNVIEWGRGVFGVEAAAQTYFQKSAAALTFEECTRLAAVIPSPLRHRPDVDSRYVLRRTGMVQRRLIARSRGESIFTTEEEPSSPDPASEPDVSSTDSTATEVE